MEAVVPLPYRDPDGTTVQGPAIVAEITQKGREELARLGGSPSTVLVARCPAGSVQRDHLDRSRAKGRVLVSQLVANRAEGHEEHYYDDPVTCHIGAVIANPVGFHDDPFDESRIVAHLPKAALSDGCAWR